MIKIQIANPDLSEGIITFLDDAYSSGTTITVRDSTGFVAQNFAVLSEPGQETTQAKAISSTTATTVVVTGAYDYDYERSSPLYQAYYDKISLERKPAGGAYAALATSPYDIQWDNQTGNTLVAVAGAATTDSFRWRFYNSVKGTYSDYSDELPGTGLTRYQVGYIIEQVRKNPVATPVDDETMIDYANDFQAVVYDEMPKAFWFVKEGTAVSTVAGTYKYSITANWPDLLSVKYILYNYVVGAGTDNLFPLTFSPIEEFYNLKSDQNQPTDDNVRRWTLLPPDTSSAKGYIGLHTTPKTVNCSIQPVYQSELSNLDSFGDTVVVPYPKGYIDYILYRIYDDIKSDTENSTKFNGRVRTDILALKKRARRQLGQPELFRFRGHKGWSQQFGSGGRLDWQQYKENYW